MQPNQETIQVLFTNKPSLREPTPNNSIVILPSNDTWNDFGFRTQIEIRVRLNEFEEDFITYGHLGILGLDLDSHRGRHILPAFLQGDSSNPVALESDVTFFTLLPNLQAYRDIVRQLSVSRAKEALIAMNDLVALNEFKPSTNWLHAAAESELFNMSFVRSSEAYFTYKNGGSILRGLEMEDLGRLSPSLGIDFQLAGCTNMHQLKFNFNHGGDTPKRINILIGKNGVGKSQTLGRIANAALKGDSSLNSGHVGERPIINRLLAFAPTNEAESVFPTGRLKRPRTWYRRFTLNRTRRESRNNYLCDIIIQLIRSDNEIKNKRRGEIFLDAIKTVDLSETIHLPTTDPGKPFIRLQVLGNGNEQDLLKRYASIDIKREPVRVLDGNAYPLSSGEISFMRFAAQACLHIENGTLLLLDEPETHLHPNFISKFISVLDSLLEQTGSSAIIATHSAYFVREVFRKQVTVIRIEDRFVRTEHPRLKTFGADIGEISYFVFGEDEPSRLAETLKAKLLSKQLSWNDLFITYKDELSSEFLGMLRASVELRDEP